MATQTSILDRILTPRSPSKIGAHPALWGHLAASSGPCVTQDPVQEEQRTSQSPVANMISTSASSRQKRKIIPVHGSSFAWEYAIPKHQLEWWERGSAIWRILEHQGHVVPFTWPSEFALQRITDARKRGGQELAAMIRAHDDESQKITLVGFSHGGNVILHALANLADADLRKIDRVYLLATPHGDFLEVRNGWPVIYNLSSCHDFIQYVAGKQNLRGAVNKMVCIEDNDGSLFSPQHFGMVHRYVATHLFNINDGNTDDTETIIFGQSGVRRGETPIAGFQLFTNIVDEIMSKVSQQYNQNIIFWRQRVLQSNLMMRKAMADAMDWLHSVAWKNEHKHQL